MNHGYSYQAIIIIPVEENGIHLNYQANFTICFRIPKEQFTCCHFHSRLNALIIRKSVLNQKVIALINVLSI